MPKRGSSRAVSSMMSPSSVAGEQPRHIGERDVHGREDDLERLGPEHHRATRGERVRCASRSVCPFHGRPGA